MKTLSISKNSWKFISNKLEEIGVLVKFKLTLIVVLTSVFGFLIVSHGEHSLLQISILVLGGFCVAGAANALNQVLEKDYDALMQRTENRPLVTNKLRSADAVLIAGILVLTGVSLLSWFNTLTGFLGMMSLVLYSFVYTPLKRYSTIAVAVGAIPGAMPVLIGATAFDGYISTMAISLFGLQFLWQFPHFWAIGYLGNEDYTKAGFKLLPVDIDGNIDRNLGFSSMIYVGLTVPIIFWMYAADKSSFLSALIAGTLSLIYLAYAYNFHKKFDRLSARKLMFFSFVYMPFILINYLVF